MCSTVPNGLTMVTPSAASCILVTAIKCRCYTRLVFPFCVWLFLWLGRRLRFHRYSTNLLAHTLTGERVESLGEPGEKLLGTSCLISITSTGILWVYKLRSGSLFSLQESESKAPSLSARFASDTYRSDPAYKLAVIRLHPSDLNRCPSFSPALVVIESYTYSTK
jgi:hypothetical protein